MESNSHIHLNNVMYVPALNKILVFVVVLEDYGCDMLFSKGKDYLNHVAIVQVKQIGVWV